MWPICISRLSSTTYLQKLYTSLSELEKGALLHSVYILPRASQCPPFRLLYVTPSTSLASKLWHTDEENSVRMIDDSLPRIPSFFFGKNSCLHYYYYYIIDYSPMCHSISCEILTLNHDTLHIFFFFIKEEYKKKKKVIRCLEQNIFAFKKVISKIFL